MEDLAKTREQLLAELHALRQRTERAEADGRRMELVWRQTEASLQASQSAEDSLRRQTAILQLIIDSMAEGVIVADQDGKFLLVNSAARRIAAVTDLNAKPAEWPDLYGIHMGDGLTPCPPDQVPLTRTLRGELVEAVDLFIRPAKIPQGRWLSVTGRPLRDEHGNAGGLVVFRDVTERRRAEEKVREYAVRLQALSQRLLQVQEDERRHFARELHDEIGQSLTGLNLALEGIGRQATGDLGGRIFEAQGVLRELMAQVRNLSLDMRPSMLDDLGLRPALEWLFRRYTEQTGVRVAFQANALKGRLDPALETAAYRIVQEALTNVARHAGVDQAAVQVCLTENSLQLQVEDQGAGFDPGKPAASSGLSGMQERAELLGGWLTVESRPGSGTRLVAHLPITGKE